MMKQEKQSIKQIVFFLLYTFSITWLSWLIIIIGNRYFDVLWYGEPLFWIPMLIGGLGPAIASYIIYRQFNENFPEKSFFKFVFYKTIDRKAWLIFGAYIIWRFFMIWISFGIDDPISILYMFINLPLFIIGGGLEELGWRGCLQTKLESISSYLPSVVMVGIIWSIWHLPLWIIKGTPQSAIPFGLYAFAGLVIAFSFTTIYKYTKSLLLCILSHAWFNGCIGLAVYIGSEGYIQFNLNWKVFVAFILELIVSSILGIVYSKRERARARTHEVNHNQTQAE